MEAAGVTLNEKCVFSVNKIKFIGHIISKEGIQVDHEKIRAIVNLARPQNVLELWRLLGIENHVGKSVKNLAETTKPLRDLLKKDTAWIWNEPQKTAFESLKEKTEYSTSTDPLQWWQGDKSFSWCIFLWFRQSTSSETRKWLETCILCCPGFQYQINSMLYTHIQIHAKNILTQ